MSSNIPTRIFLLLGIILSFITAVNNSPVSSSGTASTTEKILPERQTVLCTHTTWSDIVTFYFANYFAHLATVRPFPGELTKNHILNLIHAFLLPTGGMLRGMDAIIRHSILKAGGDLQQAAQAGALCMVVRSEDWKPAEGDTIRDPKLFKLIRDLQGDDDDEIELEPLARGRLGPGLFATYRPEWMAESPNLWPYVHSNGFSMKSDRQIHGQVMLPEGYDLDIVPRDTIIFDGDDPSETKVSSKYSFLKIFISLLQTIYASRTLYLSRGGQIERYGYASFSLTVAPYAFMSAVNLIGNLLTPIYPKLYLVDSEIMDEAKRRPGAYFSGVIGRIQSTTDGVAGTFESAEDSELVFQYANETGSENIQSEQILDTEFILKIPLCPQFLRTGKPKIRDGEDESAVIMAVGVLVGWVPIAIVGGLSNFHAGQSTTAQRVWTILWLVFGYFGGNGIAWIKNFITWEMRENNLESTNLYAACLTGLPLHTLISVFYFAPAIGGLIVVGQMLREFGNCTLI